MHHLTGHCNIMELKGTYEDCHSVNLIMELCGIGEFFDRIIVKGYYSECVAANLYCQIVTVIHDCHTMGDSLLFNPVLKLGKKLEFDVEV
ncbi:hypothetical protein JHK86_018209 [Glycine max]|nr:hypothetical protein JHK86_018209 [Glycine max]